MYGIDCAKPGVKEGLFFGSVALAALQVVTVAPWKEITLLSTVATTGTLFATISLVATAVSGIFDFFNVEEGRLRSCLETGIKLYTAVPFTALFLQTPIFAKELGVTSILRAGAHFEGAAIAYTILFMVSCVQKVVHALQTGKAALIGK